MFDTLFTVISFVLVLGVLVFFHELGHYLVARRNGIVVEEFGLGYPPRAAKLFRYDGTDFTLNWLPLGGFARMKGEDAGDMSSGSFNAASRGARAATLIAGPLMNFILAVIFFAAAAMLGTPAAAGSPLFATISPAATALGLAAGDVLLTVDGTPIQVPIVADASLTIPVEAAPGSTHQLTIIRDNAVMTLPGADSNAVKEALKSSTIAPVLMTQIEGVAEGSPAQLAGLAPGDIVYAVDGVVVTPEVPLNILVDERRGEPLTMTVLRDGDLVAITTTPRAEPPPGQGALGVHIGTINRMANMALAPALWYGVTSIGDYAMTVLSLPMLLFQGEISPEEAQVSGPVGIAQMIGGAMSASLDSGLLFPILHLSAVLSAALAIMNLLPLPALDGGRLLFILIETVRGRRVSPEREGLIHMIGFMLLLGLMLIITVRDLSSTPQTIDWARLMGQ
jgi:regulator of sigma E protease